MSIWIKDPKTNKPSISLTLFCLGFIIASVKLALSNLSFGDIHFEYFTGTDFAAVVGSLGVIYGFRKHTDKSKLDDIESHDINDEEGI